MRRCIRAIQAKDGIALPRGVSRRSYSLDVMQQSTHEPLLCRRACVGRIAAGTVDQSDVRRPHVASAYLHIECAMVCVLGQHAEALCGGAQIDDIGFVIDEAEQAQVRTHFLLPTWTSCFLRGQC